jgi:hypothetical protein
MYSVTRVWQIHVSLFRVNILIGCALSFGLRFAALWSPACLIRPGFFPPGALAEPPRFDILSSIHNI